MRDSEVATDDPAATGSHHHEALARRAAQRDPVAWREIFDAHYAAIFSFVRYRLRGASEAEDIAAHTFEVAFARANRFDWRRVPVEGWLIGIARNLVRDHVKKSSRRGYHAEIDESNTPAEPDAAPAVDLRHDLARAMRALTDDQQMVLSLRFLLDRSVEDTARVMGRSEDAVKNLQRRALAAMQRALTEAGYPGTEGVHER